MIIEDKFEIKLPDKHASRIQAIKDYLDKEIIVKDIKMKNSFQGILKKGIVYGYYFLLLKDEEKYIFNIDEDLRFYSPNF